MFDLFVTGPRPGTTRRTLPLLTSWAIHAIAIGAAIAGSWFYAADQLPEAPQEVLAYVEPVAAPPPPPPPPAAAPAPRRPAAPRPRPEPRPAPSTPVPAPIEPPTELGPPLDVAFDVIDEEGEFGGVEGGVPGGVVGGVVGGLPDAPPPPPRAERPPVRTGGALQPPALIKRVPPVYPDVAINAKIEGVVILEATVGRNGRVEDVRVLRGVPFLDRAAMEAVRQWQYEPLLLNGKPERFILTVTLNFNLT